MAATRFAGSGYNFHAAPESGAALFLLSPQAQEIQYTLARENSEVVLVLSLCCHSLCVK
jgi:hypothetical protein